MRKRDKALGPNGEAPRIDMDTLRASARAADLADKTHARAPKQPPAPAHRAADSASPREHAKPLPQHHQGSFQLVPIMTSGPAAADAGARMHGPSGMPPALPVPPPPWATGAPAAGSGARGYVPEQLQHQSFMRTSQHVAAPGHASPR